MNIRITVTGAVQGVGYRPFAAKLAGEMNIAGEVRNSGGIVEISARGEEADLERYALALKDRAPHGAHVLSVRTFHAEDEEFSGFTIVKSTASPEAGEWAENEDRRAALPVFPPDIAVCPDCVREMTGKTDRRYRYSLISCVSCGPRYTILEAFPYDRERTTMKAFPMCPACEAEYTGTGMRRRHAQTISCHDCGPQFVLSSGDRVLGEDEAVEEAVRLILGSGILALKGTGGYQLLCLASDEAAVRRLRELKGRETKPFAVMFADADQAAEFTDMDSEERALLESDARPIVLIRKSIRREERAAGEDRPLLPDIAPSVCGDSRFVGAFLPSVGMHLLLTERTGPLVVTSANLSGMPIPVRDEEMLGEEALIKADAVLWHGRKILRPMDDSVVFRQNGRTAFIRRSRGYVPLPVIAGLTGGEKKPEAGMLPDILAFGADLKAAFAVCRGDRIISSQYFGDLEDRAVLANYRAGIGDMCSLYGVIPGILAADLHPRYFSRAEALAMDKNAVGIQHHHAHAASVMAEHGIVRCVGVTLDGTGFGLDGSLWGGEIFLLEGSRAVRAGRLLPIRLCGGDAASRDAGLAAESYRYAAGRQCLNPLVQAAVVHGVGTVESSSTGRLFDAVSAFLGIAEVNRYEGECAVLLEKAAEEYEERVKGSCTGEEGTGVGCPGPAGAGNSPYLLVRKAGERTTAEIDQASLAGDLLSRAEKGEDRGLLAYSFHLELSRAISGAVSVLAEDFGTDRAVLSGGVFANRLLRRMLEQLLHDAGLEVYFNEQVPMNDGGIAAGQAFLVRMALLEGQEPDSLKIAEEDLCV